MSYKRKGEAVEKKYLDAEDVFRKESREEFKQKYPNNIWKAIQAQKAAWAALSDKQKEKYTKLYEESVKEYEKELAQFNGGSKKEGGAQQEPQIPPKPKHGLNAYLFYVGQQREEYVRQNPGKSPQEIAKGLSEMYNSLTWEQQQHYKQKAKKQADIQDKLIEQWEEQYGDKEEKKKSKKDARKQTEIKDDSIEKKEEQQFLQYSENQWMMNVNQKSQNKYGRNRGSYQEIIFKKEKRKLVPLGEEETKQEGKEIKRANQFEQADSKVQQEQDYKVQQGQERPKKSEEQKDRSSISRSSLDEKVSGRGRGRPKKLST